MRVRLALGRATRTPEVRRAVAALRDTMNSTSAELVEATARDLTTRIATAEADLKAAEKAPRVRTSAPEAARWARSRDRTAKDAADRQAEATRLDADATAAEKIQGSWWDRFRSVRAHHRHARRERATTIAATRARIADLETNAAAYKNASGRFEEARTRAAQAHRAAEDRAHETGLARRRRQIEDLREAVTMVRADPLLAIEARVSLASALKEWRARVEADELEPGYEPP